MVAPTIDPSQFNDQQKRAVELALEWYRGWVDGLHRKQVFFLAGFAGTGKTTVARHIADLFSAGSQTKVEFIAPTGKAASRLRQKGCTNAKTMHQFIYNVRGEDEEGEPIFVGKTVLDSYPRAVLLDEASMVGAYDLSNLKSHNLPILALGDIGQLPPVKAQQVFNEHNMDVLLDQIERNAGNIARASMFVRQGKQLPFREYEDVKVRPGRPTDNDLMAHIDANSQILAAYHNTREDINRRVRQIMGYTNDLPQIGEKIVCRFNQHAHNIMNGEQGIVIGYDDIPTYELEDNEMDGMQYVTYESLTYGGQRRAKFNPACFYMGDANIEIRRDAMKGVGAWDYGACLTIHSAQGSEWDNVLMMDERMRSVPYEKLAYTGITRAISHLQLMRA